MSVISLPPKARKADCRSLSGLILSLTPSDGYHLDYKIKLYATDKGNEDD